jgi:tRNA(Ile)-lysidine synthase
MPPEALREGLVWARPWLDRPREAIEAYVRRHRLRHIEDGSNADARHARNRLRLAVWPALIAAFPDSEAALAAAARRAHEAAACLRELAQADLAVAAVEDGLSWPALQALSLPRRANLLRAWLCDRLPAGLPETLLQRLLRELPGEPGARWQIAAGELRCYRDRLSLLRSAATNLPPDAPQVGSSVVPTCDLRRPGRHPVPAWAGAWVVEAVEKGGIAVERLRQVELRGRSGGETFQRAPDTPPRSLKKQFQAAGIPAWRRDGPLLYDATGVLLCVPALGIDARQRAPVGMSQRRLVWESDTASEAPPDLPSDPTSGRPPRAG